MKVKKVKIKDIKIPEDFRRKPPRGDKMKERWFYYRRTGRLKADIVVNKNGQLVDGYTSYLIAEADGIKAVKVIER